jgi:hypothetical protein
MVQMSKVALNSESYDIETHDLKSSGQRIRWFPYIPPAPPDLDGRCISHKLVALGHWNDDVEVAQTLQMWQHEHALNTLLHPLTYILKHVAAFRDISSVSLISK